MIHRLGPAVPVRKNPPELAPSRTYEVLSQAGTEYVNACMYRYRKHRAKYQRPGSSYIGCSVGSVAQDEIRVPPKPPRPLLLLGHPSAAKISWKTNKLLPDFGHACRDGPILANIPIHNPIHNPLLRTCFVKRAGRGRKFLPSYAMHHTRIGQRDHRRVFP